MVVYEYKKVPGIDAANIYGKIGWRAISMNDYEHILMEKEIKE